MIVLLGISGGIAAYKAPEIVRAFQRRTYQVACALTPDAARFVSPMVLRTLTGGQVLDDLFAAEETGIGHITFADRADVMVVAPATAQTIARLAHGFADEPVSLSFLAATCPRIIFPAMNSNMWQQAPVQQNVALLRERGHTVIDPDSGELACGWTGPGRLPDPERIVREVAALLAGSGRLSGRRVLITAGPTREFIDPVRFLSNPSTGKMGFALAEAARDAGAQVVLVHGPVTMSPPDGVEAVAVVSAEDMSAAVERRILEDEPPDVFIGAAAVADYTPADRSPSKLKKDQPLDAIPLQRTPDILATVSASGRVPVCIGFAAETNDVIDNAREKLSRKGLALVIANQVGTADAGFAHDHNEVHLVSKDSVVSLPRASKADLARTIISTIADLVDNVA
ncbi:MAG: bifunctional phosphopantothenoylcysteine decarboxylase/phosphopantothenate--cysteine ligase CoaBC [Candidatus Dadabacteria bacterium]|nr:MAG: bifunctional phosphopantothenoylcysteine decarboxylase/phosphopantothenate--cysteine ligase CoaBC [Candidatus Dadabacteria bacterium]